LGNCELEVVSNVMRESEKKLIFDDRIGFGAFESIS